MSIENIKTYDDLLLEAKEAKYPQIWTVYQEMVDDVESSGITGNDPQKGRKLNEKSNKRLTKKSNGQSLSTKEEEDEEWYDEFMDWSDSNHDAADSGCDVVEAMSDIDTVNAYDPINDPSWLPFI